MEIRNNLEGIARGRVGTLCGKVKQGWKNVRENPWNTLKYGGSWALAFAVENAMAVWTAHELRKKGYEPWTYALASSFVRSSIFCAVNVAAYSLAYWSDYDSLAPRLKNMGKALASTGTAASVAATVGGISYGALMNQGMDYLSAMAPAFALGGCFFTPLKLALDSSLDLITHHRTESSDNPKQE